MERTSDKVEQSKFISIALDNYDDVFSDFDPRNYSERNVSDDFLYEVRKVANENEFHVSELKLILPEKNRSKGSEEIIIKRLHAHFRKNHHYYIGKKKSERRRGILLTLLGMAMMVCASYVSASKSDNFFKHVLLVMLEPAGWFLVWVGLDHFVYVSRERKPELDFYNKMARSKILFIGG